MPATRRPNLFPLRDSPTHPPMSHEPHDRPPPPSDYPSYIVHADDVPETEGCYSPPFDGEKLSLYRELGKAAGSRNYGFSIERLLPGRRTSFTHAHTHEEELVYVAEGTCHVRIIEPDQNPRELALRQGHAVSFPAGTGIAHTFINHGEEECTLIVVGERKGDRDRVFYPDDHDYDAHHAETRPEQHWHRR